MIKAAERCCEFKISRICLFSSKPLPGIRREEKLCTQKLYSKRQPPNRQGVCDFSSIVDNLGSFAIQEKFPTFCLYWVVLQQDLVSHYLCRTLLSNCLHLVHCCQAYGLPATHLPLQLQSPPLVAFTPPSLVLPLSGMKPEVSQSCSSVSPGWDPLILVSKLKLGALQFSVFIRR